MDAAVSVTDMEILPGRQAWVRNSLETLGSAGMGHRVLSTDGLGSDSPVCVPAVTALLLGNKLHFLSLGFLLCKMGLIPIP